VCRMKTIHQILIFSGLILFPDAIFKTGHKTDPGSVHDKMFEIMSPDQIGIHFQNTLEEGLFMNGLADNYFYNGAGQAVADYNNDGLQDICFPKTMSPNK